ncbi:hypothetical protein F2P44_07965 [Massilia sp. CCM 8695]|uniref:LPXTG cell wall anchor domain-containing protein n=1 Tax=Massilia frigida TaxID=2609281 RepID=A0ABX0NFE1_9BURK|nr:hypothetical protein [Massilia frigida]NHZ79210.1 hypothetical protein [Massilia frigida]
MTKDDLLGWSGLLSVIAGLMILLMTFDRPGWEWQAGGALLVLIGILLIWYRRRRRSDESGDDRDLAGLDDISSLDGD